MFFILNQAIAILGGFLYRFDFYADKRPENLFIKRSIVFSPIIFCGSAPHNAIGFLFSFWIEWNIAYLIGLVAYSGFVHISFYTHISIRMIYKVCGFVRRIRLLFILFNFMIFFFSFALFRIVIGTAH